MKKTTFATLILSVIFSIFNSNAQLLLEENFDYDAARTLILNPIASSDNYDGVTGWSTQSNTLSATNCFDITNAPLNYAGYVNAGIGNALKYNGQAGQGVFKLFSKNVRNDSTVYISFMINFPADAVSGGDYFLGIKMEPSATSTNWGGRLYASVNPTYPNEEVTLGINKMSGGTTTWVNATTGPFYPVNKTHLMVIKYKVGIINGTSAATEAGKFDDVMELFVNPVTTGVEPATATLRHADAAQNDLYRYTSSGLVFGGARGLYLRTPAVGNAPAYTIDGIRVGLTWAEVVPAPSGLKNASADNFSFSVDANKQISVFASARMYNSYNLVSLSGQQLLSGILNNQKINASALKSGVYILNLVGSQKASAKIVIQ